MINVSGARIASKELFDAYTSWAENAGETPQNIKWFGRHLSDKGFKSYKVKGVKVYRDLALRNRGDSGDSNLTHPNYESPRSEPAPVAPDISQRDSRDSWTHFPESPTRAGARAHEEVPGIQSPESLESPRAPRTPGAEIAL